MKLLYPITNPRSKPTDSQLALKIARHSPCSTCNTCSGLRPSPDVELVLIDASSNNSLGNIAQYGSDDDDLVTEYLETCVCGHDVKEHGANVLEIGLDEFNRRGRAAMRLDENLQVRFRPYTILLH